MDFQMNTGDSFVIEINVTTTESGLSLEGASITWALSQFDYTAAKITKTLLSGISVPDPTKLYFEVDLMPADTQGLAGTYYHEAEIRFGDGSVATVIRGKAAISRTLIP